MKSHVVKSHVVKGPFPLYELCRIAPIVTKSWPKALFLLHHAEQLWDIPQDGSPLVLAIYKDLGIRSKEIWGDTHASSWIITIEIWDDHFAICSGDSGTSYKLAQKIKALFW